MKYKKSVKLTSLINDEYILLGAEAEGLFRRRERGVWIKRALVIAACLSLLTVGVAAILLPALRRDEPPQIETETAEEEDPSVFYLSEKSYVTVQYLVAGKETEGHGTETAIPDGDRVQPEEVNARIGNRLILIHVTCDEGETVTVTPTAHSRLLPAYRTLSSDGYVRWKVWNEAHQAYDHAEAYCSDWGGKPLEDIGRSVTVTEDTTLLWQYEIREAKYENSPVLILPCIEDNFVDFMVTDAQGRITGGGSIYIGGLDITALTEDHTYYADNWVVYNAIYRPCVLGSYRYHAEDGTPVSEDFHAETVAALHATAHEQRDALFEDLTPDSPLFSMREFYPDHRETFGERHENGYSWGMSNWIHRSETMPYDLILLESDYSDRRFLLYDFSYNEIAETVIEIDNGYGYMVKGCYVMVDGTRIYVDESTPEGFVIVPPTESETQ